MNIKGSWKSDFFYLHKSVYHTLKWHVNKTVSQLLLVLFVFKYEIHKTDESMVL